jgi:two-component system chemotaxis response regulator CheB
MPEGYTAAFAQRLDGDCALDVMEAREGLRLRPGLAIVARAGMHLCINRDEDGWVSRLDMRPLDTLHRPAVDVLFASGAAQIGSGTLAVVLTGMGTDGLAGAKSVVAAGGRVLSEAEASCVVYGMPRAIAEAGLSTAEAPIEAMAGLVCDHL